MAGSCQRAIVSDGETRAGKLHNRSRARRFSRPGTRVLASLRKHRTAGAPRQTTRTTALIPDAWCARTWQ